MDRPETDATISTGIVGARRERDLRPHYLEQTDTAGPLRKISLDQDLLIIGRAEEADVRLPSQRASRQHAMLTRRGLDYVIRDNDSRNGVFLNGVKVHSAVLREGDILQIASSVFIYREG